MRVERGWLAEGHAAKPCNDRRWEGKESHNPTSLALHVRIPAKNKLSTIPHNDVANPTSFLEPW